MYFNFGFIFFHWISKGNTSSAIGLKICAVTAGIKKHKSIIKKKIKNKRNKLVLLTKSKLNRIQVLVSKSLIEFILINNAPK